MGGEECNYWNYLYRDPGATEWTYSALGAVLRKVSPGSVEAWVWGSGNTPPADEWTFEAICLPPTPLPTDTPQPATSIPATVTATPGEVQAAAPLPTAAPTTTPLPPSPTPPGASESEPSLVDYWPFAITVLGLGVMGVIVWRRRS
jgi:hypothetical protein